LHGPLLTVLGGWDPELGPYLRQDDPAPAGALNPEV
jgi:hypothetical protein